MDQRVDNTRTTKKLLAHGLFYAMLVIAITFASPFALAQERDPSSPSDPTSDPNSDPNGDPNDPAHTPPERPDDLKNPDICVLPPPDDIAAAPDPGAFGPFGVLTDDYGSYAPVYQAPIDSPLQEERGRVYYPDQLACGPFPLILMQPGRHATCHGQNVNQDWPCDPGDDPIESHLGFAYLAERLASHGYIVVGISANAVNHDTQNDREARGWLFQRHLDLWSEFDTFGGPDFGKRFVGRVDLDRVGTLGHSRGGEGAMVHHRINEDLGSPYDIRGIFTIGATANQRPVVHGTPVAALLPYCDGDIRTLESVSFFDDARYSAPGDPAEKYTHLVLGANHAYYNTMWDPDIFAPGSKDDWHYNEGDDDAYCSEDGGAASGRLTGDEQRGSAIALATAFFRTHVGGESFRSFLRGDVAAPPSALGSDIYTAYLPGDTPATRRDVNRMTSIGNETTNTLNAPVSTSGFERFEWCDPETSAEMGCLENMASSENEGREYRFPHAVQPFYMPQLRLSWTLPGATFENELPEGSRDVGDFRAIQFRGVVDFTDTINPSGQPQDLRIELEDGAGQIASAIVSTHSKSLLYPPSDDAPVDADSAIPKAVFHTVRVPLDAFDEILLQDVRAVRLVFDQTRQGAINVADLAFADEANNLSPDVTASVALDTLDDGGDKLWNVGLSIGVTDDDFGPIASVHVFSDEDDVDSQAQQSSPDAKDLGDGTLRLRGEVDKDLDGRVYVVVAASVDPDGAIGYACTTVALANGNQPEDVAAAEAQRDDAAERCTEFAAAAMGMTFTPAGFHVVGDGPVIGPNQ